MSKIVSVIMFRKESKRLPNKSIKLLNGKPLYLYTFEFAKFLGYPCYVCHNYDYEQIKIFEEFNYFYNGEFAGDNHLTVKEIKALNTGADIFILLQITSPIRDFMLTKSQIDQFINSNFDTGFHACKMKSGFYYVGGREINYLTCLRDYSSCKYRQEVYKETGSLYIFRKNMLEKDHIMDTENKVLFDTPFDFDIDDIEEFRRVEEFIKVNEY